MASADGTSADAEPWTLRGSVRDARVFLESLSPENDASAAAGALAAADAADAHVAAGIHAGYQAVKGVANDTPPAIVLAVTGAAVALPSVRFGPVALVRNTSLALGLAAALIYPDKLKSLSREQ